MNHYRHLKIINLLIACLIIFPALAISGQFKVNRVIDGNTIVLEGGDRVRLIGVDTPETKHPDKPIECYGEQAAEFTKTTLENKVVIIKFDPRDTHINHKDKYGKMLGYIYLLDGTFFNAELIKQGYARAYTRYDFQYIQEFIQYEQSAKSNHLGLWSECRPPYLEVFGCGMLLGHLYIFNDLQENGLPIQNMEKTIRDYIERYRKNPYVRGRGLYKHTLDKFHFGIIGDARTLLIVMRRNDVPIERIEKILYDYCENSLMSGNAFNRNLFREKVDSSTFYEFRKYLLERHGS